MALIVAITVLVPVGAVVARRCGRAGILGALFAGSLAVELAATLHPEGAISGGSRGCVVNGDMFLAVGTQQWLLNLAMFVPVALFAGLLFRNTFLTVATPILLSATTEVAQALVGLGRACDSDDVVANSAGAVVGAVLAFGINRFRPNDDPPRSRHRSETETHFTSAVAPPAPLYGTIAGFVVLAIVWAGWIERLPYGVDGAFEADGRQRAVAERVTRSFLGADTDIQRIQYIKSANGMPPILAVSTPGNSLEIQWPSGELSQLSDNRPVTQVPAAERLPAPRIEANAIAFMREHFPWATDARRRMDPSGEWGDQHVGWTSVVDGVLMPKRLDIVLDARGNVATISARNIPDPVLPPVRVRDETAARRAMQQARPDLTAQAGILLAVEHRGRWRPAWRFPLTDATHPNPIAIGMLDAETGEVL
ncbi:VanZ family protein (plasmid) [Embleya sp. NBC_00888]|uniref:VanZ family protein n=1 Tax=Embleya sp. NBC_00888 TaxID=2975960 RepID=UPI00386F90A5|nr:VanZ family protein [Embleya sp. NBC_00888]